MKLLGLTVLTFFLNLPSYGQSHISENAHCMADVTLAPGFMAITSSEGTKIDEWYQNIFGMKVVKEFNSSDGNSRGVILKKDEFIVEIIYRQNNINQQLVLEKSKSKHLQGFLKFGVFTNANLDLLKQCLIRKNVNPGRIFHDQELALRLLNLNDPDGNTIELISTE